MYSHFEKKLAYLLHPKTASRATAVILKKRGFVPDGGYHSGDHHDGFKYYCTVRNHFDVLSSWFWLGKYEESCMITVDFIKVWSGGSSRLWNFVREFNPEILKYENLRDDLNDFLVENGLEPLSDLELRVDPDHVTKDKPRIWEPYWTQEARDYVERVYAEELKDLDYVFLSNPVDKIDNYIIKVEDLNISGRCSIQCLKCDRSFSVVCHAGSGLLCSGCGYRCSSDIKAWYAYDKRHPDVLLERHGFIRL